jgi:hypothetical protein
MKSRQNRTGAAVASATASDDTNKGAGAGAGLLLSWPMGHGGGLAWSLLVYPARRVAVGRDLSGRAILWRGFKASSVGAAADEIGAAWARVHAYLGKLDQKRAAAAAARRLGFPLSNQFARPATGGGGGGVWRKPASQGGKAKRVSTAGGGSVRSTEAARLAADWGERSATARARGAMVGAVGVAWSDLDSLPIRAALVSGYAPAGSLLAEIQGQLDLTVCRQMSAKLLESMRRDGKQTSATTGEDAGAAGCVALARWRCINGKFPARRVRGSLGGVAWRAIVRESSRDLLGDAVHLGRLVRRCLGGFRRAVAIVLRRRFAGGQGGAAALRAGAGGASGDAVGAWRCVASCRARSARRVRFKSHSRGGFAARWRVH